MWELIRVFALNITSAGAVLIKDFIAFSWLKGSLFMSNFSKAQWTNAWPFAILTPVRRQPSDLIICVGRAIDTNTRL